MSDVLDELRKQVQKCSKSRYAISQETGISQGQLSDFVAGYKGLGIDAIERLAKCLNYQLILRKRRERK